MARAETLSRPDEVLAREARGSSQNANFACEGRGSIHFEYFLRGDDEGG